MVTASSHSRLSHDRIYIDDGVMSFEDLILVVADEVLRAFPAVEKSELSARIELLAYLGDNREASWQHLVMSEKVKRSTSFIKRARRRTACVPVLSPASCSNQSAYLCIRLHP